MFLQMILGLQPEAPDDRLYVDPALPDWLCELTVTNLQVGERNLDLRFWRDRESTRWQVLKGKRHVVAYRDCASGDRFISEAGQVAAP